MFKTARETSYKSTAIESKTLQWGRGKELNSTGTKKTFAFKHQGELWVNGKVLEKVGQSDEAIMFANWFL